MRGVTPAALPRWGTAAPDVSKCKKNVKKSLSLLHMSKKSSTFAANFHICGLVHNSKTSITMAKQSGIHQLRGKVGEHSYYRQTGVASGLVRSINQAMSNRVKTGDEYANTRLNNAEFGQACRVAAEAIKSIVPKFRPMVLPFSQSKTAKLVLEVIKAGTGNWGMRNFVDADGESLATILNSLKKNDPDEFGLATFTPAVDSVTLDFVDPQFSSKLSAIGADGVDVRVEACNLYVGKYVESTGDYQHSYIRSDSATETITDATDQEFSVELPANPQGTAPFYGTQFYMVVILPYRTINSVKHVLQENCTFRAYSKDGSF